MTRVQKLASRAATENRHVIVVGNPDHPEMIGVKGYAPEHAFVVKDASEIAASAAFEQSAGRFADDDKITDISRYGGSRSSQSDWRNADCQYDLLGNARPAGRGSRSGGRSRCVLYYRRKSFVEQPQAAFSLQRTVREKLSD